MNTKLKYYFLSNIGITIWMPRNSAQALMVSQPILNAALLVLLPEKLPQERCIAWVRNLTEKNQRVLIKQAIHHWSPYHVLVVGETLAQFLLNDSKSLDELRIIPHAILGLESLLHVTYHPAELENSPENKRKAYQDLLRLKLQISQARME